MAPMTVKPENRITRTLTTISTWKTTTIAYSSLLPLLLCSLFFLGLMLDVVDRSMDLNDNQLVYGLDDAYIHMSIARNFAEEGVWGITPYAYSSTTSSPLWTLMIAVAYLLVGVNDVTPLVLNLVIGLLAPLAAHNLLMRFQVPGLYRFGVLLALILFTPFSTLALSGMEHLLQILLAFLLMDYALRYLQSPEPTIQEFAYWRVPLIAMLVAMTRYEGLLIIFSVCVLLALWGRPKYALLVAAAALVPVSIYGLIAVSHGWQFVPASLSVKSGSMSYLSSTDWSGRFTFLFSDTYNIFANQHVLSLPLLAALGLSLYRYDRSRNLWDERIALLAIFVTTSLMSVRLVSWPDAGTFARYEAYLIAMALLVIPAALGPLLPRRVSLKGLPVLLCALALGAFLINDIYNRYVQIAFRQPIVTATTEIYRQQYQMGLFLARYYNQATIATNDIGAVNYLSDITNVDLWGLGTIEVARAKSTSSYTSDVMRQITLDAGVEMAIVYDDWFSDYGGVPEDWILVERWQYEPSPVILGNTTISFYVMNEADVALLQQNIDEFAPSLPSDVTRIEA